MEWHIIALASSVGAVEERGRGGGQVFLLFDLLSFFPFLPPLLTESRRESISVRSENACKYTPY